MVKVIKKDGSIQAFKAAKIVKACKGAGVSAPVAETIAKIISKKVSGKKTVKSKEIKAMVFDIFDNCIKAKNHWINYKR